MKKLAALAIVAVATIALSASTASAQNINFGSGYGFGVGNQFGRSVGRQVIRGNRGLFNFGRIGFSPRIEEPPYFAKFPPVYYSGIVKRPYGVSPYAAPPGVTPVEMAMPAPQNVKNPYYGIEVQPVADEKAEPVEPSTDGKSTSLWTKNPYEGSHVSN